MNNLNLIPKVNVAIVGSGISGLWAAKLLNDSSKFTSKTLSVLEAADYVGGRIKQDFNFVNFGLDLGAEFIHGSNTVLQKTLNELSIPCEISFIRDENLQENETRIWYFIGKEHKFYPYHTKDQDILHFLDALNPENISKIPPKTTMIERLVQEKVPLRVIGLADSIIAKTEGSDLEKCGIVIYANESNKASTEDYGDDNLRPLTTFKPLIEFAAKNINIKTNWQVKIINYSNISQPILLVNQNGEKLLADQVIVTVPITVLRDGDIQFIPEIKHKQIAASNLNMQPGLKVILKFSESFWPENHSLVACGDLPFPQFWFRKRNGFNLAIGFLTGNAAAYMSTLSHKRCAEIFLRQLDFIYAVNENPAPATTKFLDSLTFDWSKEKFIRGGYSSGGLDPNARHIIAQNIDNRIFFAGEATEITGAAATAHGAMQSGQRVANEILVSLGPKSRL
eukprot:TRINITY_DN3990_c1_g1_i1.p1 TRINITY_DN3990_c1_g1~~TRINITY_DN3990_c1_g1_i1.p1  ORF type:complete len:452 (-),score=209.65 TRINITY_DN3990_c1_g1_i1:56-1411(-)